MNEGLTATMINEIVDISSQALNGVEEGMSDSERQAIIDVNLEGVRASLLKKDYQYLIHQLFFVISSPEAILKIVVLQSCM